MFKQAEAVKEPNDELDVEEDDPRGKYTKRIIKELVDDLEFGSESLKLIVVYTGEDIIEDITEEIYNEITSVNMPFELKKACPPVLFANDSAVKRVEETLCNSAFI